MNNKKMNKKGFTIVELVIVIAVIAILAGVMIPTFGGIIKTANESAVSQTAAAVYKQVYALDLSDGTIDGLQNKKAIGEVESTKQEASAPASEPAYNYYVYTVDATNGKVTSFVYRDVSKNITSTYTASSDSWSTVSDS